MPRRRAAPTARDLRIALLLDVYDQAFDHRAWHGTPLRGSIRGLTHREALWRPGPRRHNIWEIVLHTAYWKCMVRRRLTRDPEVKFPRQGSNWFDLPEPAHARAWKRDVALLRQQHALLRRAIERFPATRLRARAWRSTWNNEASIYGIASHDLYHAGQIQLIKAISRQRIAIS